jgi:YbbR domain-containing protein
VKAPWPFRHIGLKLLSLAIALMLWMAVAGEETVERGLRVPLELQQLPAGVELTGDVPTTVDVRVRGASSALSRISAGDVVAVLDLRSARTGRRVFPLTPDQVRAPFGIDVAQVTPSAVGIVFESSASRRVPVVPAIDGHPAPGFVVGARSVEPSSVEIVGPESSVKRATEVVTEAVSVAGASDRVREVATLGLTDPSLRLKSVRSATVDVQIMPAPMERTLHSLPVHLRNLSAALTAEASPTAVAVSVRGSREVMARIGADEVSAYVDLAGLGAGQYQLTVHADAASDAGVMHIEPPTVQVLIAGAK